MRHEPRTPANPCVRGDLRQHRDVFSLLLAGAVPRPKPILPVLGKPLLAHQLAILAGIGVKKVVVVIGHLGHEVVRALGDGSKYGVEISYVEQEETLGIAHAVSRLEPHVDRPFFLFLGAIFFETGNLGAMAERLTPGRGVDGVLACKREPDKDKIKRNFVVLVGENGWVQRVIEKRRHPRTDLKGCGIYLFDVTFFDAVRRTPHTALRNEYEITDSIQIYIDDGYRVEAAEVVKEDLNHHLRRRRQEPDPRAALLQAEPESAQTAGITRNVAAVDSGRGTPSGPSGDGSGRSGARLDFLSAGTKTPPADLPRRAGTGGVRP